MGPGADGDHSRARCPPPPGRPQWLRRMPVPSPPVSLFLTQAPVSTE